MIFGHKPILKYIPNYKRKEKIATHAKTKEEQGAEPTHTVCQIEDTRKHASTVILMVHVVCLISSLSFLLLGVYVPSRSVKTSISDSSLPFAFYNCLKVLI